MIRDHPLCLCMFKACWLNRPACMPPRKLSTLSTRRSRPPPAVVRLWHHRHLSHTFVVLFFFPLSLFPSPSHFHLQPQKIRARSIPAGEERSVLQKEQRRGKINRFQSTFISRHQTSHAMKQHAAAWHIDNLKTYDKKRGSGAGARVVGVCEWEGPRNERVIGLN